MSTCRLQPEHLMTRDERRELRFQVNDLEAQLARCTDPARAAQLETQLGSLKREQQYDRQVSPRKTRKPGRGR